MKKIILLASTGLILTLTHTAFATETIKIGDQSDPFEDEMSQKFGQIFSGFFNNVGQPGGFGDKKFIPFHSMSINSSSADMQETKDSVEISVEMPGAKKEDIDVEINPSLVSIKYENKESTDKKSDNSTMKARSFGSFTRQFSIPTYTDTDKAKAQYKDGILYISIPKTEQAKIKTRKLEIK